MKNYVAAQPEQNVHLELIGEMYRAFEFFNAHFKSNLPRPVITISSVGKRKALGWFSHDIWKIGKETKHEINIGAEALAAGVDQAIEILIHEMAHLKNFVAKIDDCNEQHRHNKHFKVAAEFFGLAVKSSPRFGSAHTSLTDSLRDLIKNKLNLNLELFQLYRKQFNEIKKPKDPNGLKPVMIGKDVKELIETTSEAMGMSQKDFTTNAAKSYAKLPERIKMAAIQIYIDRNQDMFSPRSIEAYLLNLLMEKEITESKKGK